jgi:hypothetical protein
MQAGPTANLAFQDKVGQPGVSWQSEEFVLPNIRGIFEPLFLPLRLLGCDAQVTMQVFLVAGAGAGWNWRFDLEAGSISPLSIGQDGEITVSVRPLGGNPSFELALGAQAGARFTLRAPNCLGDFSLPGVKIGWSVAARTDAAPPGNGVTLPVAATSCEQLDFVSLMLKLAGIPAAPGLVDFNLGGLEVCPVLEVRGASVTGSIQTPTSRHGPLELPITSSVRLPVRPTGSSIPLTISELQYRPQVVARVHAYGVAFGQRIGGWTSDRLWTIDARATAPNQHLTLSAAPSPVARPAAPANVHGTGISASEIRLTWSDVATNEQGYRVKRWGGAWTTIATLGPGSTTFTDTGLLANSEYAYLVCAYNAAGEACAPNPWLSVKTTAATTVNCSSDQYKAEYFNNRHLSGSPTLTRCESWPINHDWGSGGPGGGVGTDNFSARWTGTAYIAAGTYTFIARADDGIRVWLSNVLIIDEWRDQAPTEFRVTRSVPAGIHSIRVEYYENVFGAVAQFRWEQAATQTPPSTPPRVYAEAISSSQIFVTWGDVDNETSYRLTDNISTFTLAANTTSYTWGGLQANTRKCFSVQAVNGAGSSAWSGWVCATTLPPSGPPTAPANVQGTGISASEIRLTWSDVATNEQGYRVKRWGGAWTTIATLGPGSTTFTDTGLLANSEYAYLVCAYNAAGEACAPNPWLSVKTTAATTVNCSSDQYKAEYFNNRHLSGSPTLTRCESWPINHDWGSGGPGGGVGTDNFSARWTGTAYIAAGTYTFIARADDGIRVWLSNVLIIDEWRDQAPTEFRVTRSVPAGIHSIRVEYYENVFGAVAQFRWEQAATQTPPSTPPRVYAEAISSSQIFVTWGDVDNETSYRLTDNISTFTLAANTTSYTWGGLQANTRKCFSVQAVNGAGSSAWSGWVCATTLPPSGPPTAPANVQGTGISASEIRLTWSDVATNEQGYRVKRWGGAWTTIATLGPGSTTFTDTGLLANSEYAYPVCAYNAAGEACAPDPWLSARTPAGTPPCAPPPGPPGEVVEGRLIVNYRPGYAPHEITDPAAKQRIASAFQTAGVIAQEKAFESLDFRFVRYYILYLSPGTCLTKAYGILMSLPELASVEYSYIAYHFHTADVVSAGVTPAPPP